MRPDESALTSERFQHRLDDVLERSRSIGDAILQQIPLLARSRRTEARSLAMKFRRGVRTNDALRNRDLLAICIPLVENSNASMTGREASRIIPETELAEQVGRGLQIWGTRTIERDERLRRVVVAFTYPVLMLTIAMGILAAFAFLLVPPFEQMFDEFGLVLPVPTMALIGISQAIRQSALSVLAAVGGIVVLVFVVEGVVIAIDRQSAMARFIRTRFRTRRSAIAEGMHLTADMLSVGLDANDSLKLAARASDEPQLLFAVATANRSEAEPPGRGLPLVNQAMVASSNGVLDRDQLATCFHDIADVYRCRDGAGQSLWAEWFSALATLMIGLMIFFVILALFMPLVSLITGLT
ncbi:MAG: hypothetical protein AAGA03_17310 [Planctomycetota bacterium]